MSNIINIKHMLPNKQVVQEENGSVSEEDLGKIIWFKDVSRGYEYENHMSPEQLTTCVDKLVKHCEAIDYIDNLDADSYKPFIVLTDSNGMMELKFVGDNVLPDGVTAMIVEKDSIWRTLMS